MAASQIQQIQELENSFKIFNRVSSQLESSYHRLEDRVTQLHGELANQSSSQPTPQRETNFDAERLRAIMMALPAGIVVLDGTGRLSEFNPAAEALLGTLECGEIWASVIARAFAPRSDDGHEISLHDGRRVSISTCPLGKEPGQVLLISDVTETRALQDNLGQHQRLMAMGEMAAGLAHQIRTPLASSILFASQLKNTHLDAEKRSQITEKVMGQLRQLESLISDMLIFSRSGYSGEEHVSVQTLLGELTANISLVCKERGISLLQETGCGALTVKGNSRILGSALLNLANNAIQAIGQKGILRLSAQPGVCDTIDISVEDDGPGIPQDIQKELFKPFFTTRNDGTGLGLAVVQAVAKAHGGNVRLESIEGRGSRFIFQLPIAAGKVSAPDYQEEV